MLDTVFSYALLFIACHVRRDKMVCSIKKVSIKIQRIMTVTGNLKQNTKDASNLKHLLCCQKLSRKEFAFDSLHFQSHSRNLFVLHIRLIVVSVKDKIFPRRNIGV